MKFQKYTLALAASVALFSMPSYAALFDVNFARAGNSGFGASLFHKADSDNHMSGDTLGNIVTGVNGDGPIGTYDSVTGELFVTLSNIPTHSQNHPPVGFTLSGIVLFDASGVLFSDSTLDLDFLAADEGRLADGTIGFNAGYVCCGNNNFDPNSFLPTGDLRGSSWMTLWGANINTDNPWEGEYDNKTNLGMDLRLDLTPSRGLSGVPIPAAAWLFGSGLIGLVGVARRKTV